jgi:hypothetical protein
VVAETVNELVAESVLPELIVNDARDAVLAFTVTVYPPSITTISLAIGTGAPGAPPDVKDHVAVEFQLPVATEYLLVPPSANTFCRNSTVKKISVIKCFMDTLEILPEKVLKELDPDQSIDNAKDFTPLKIFVSIFYLCYV